MCFAHTIGAHMQYYYGDQNILRALDEAEFWKHQESEHTTVIQLVTPDLEAEYVQILNDFKRDFDRVYGQLVRFIESVIRSKGKVDEEMLCEIKKWLVYGIEQSQKFVNFLDHLLKQSEAVKGSVPSQTVINHIIRESQYFIGIEELIA